MKKAVPVALVLIAGAAVVLWFGNRLNSWILGGLIGGLASLLLSIPISLTLFSYLARQHDEQGQYAPVHRQRLRSGRSTSELDYLPDERDVGYHDEEYPLVEDEISTIVEEQYQPRTTRRDSRWLDEEFGSSLPPARQLPPTASSRHTTRNISGRQVSPSYGMQQRKTTPPVQQNSDGEEGQRTRRTTARPTAYSGLPGNQQTSFRSRFRSDALHTARLEAVQQYVEENDTYLEDSSNPSISPSARSRRGRSPRTDHMLPDPFSASEDIYKPLQRRAPYTYEDDEIRQEISRRRETPPVRRSSRDLRAPKHED